MVQGLEARVLMLPIKLEPILDLLQLEWYSYDYIKTRGQRTIKLERLLCLVCPIC